MVVFSVKIVFIPIEQKKTNLNCIKEYVKINEILEFNQYEKSDKAPFIIYADLECIIEKINGYKYNHKNSPTT